VRKCPCVALIGILLLSVTIAHAQVTVREYLESKDSEVTYSFITGIVTGYLWANGALVTKHGSPLFCQPVKLSLSGRTYLHILDQAIKADPKLIYENAPVALALLEGLKKTFPCTVTESPRP